MRESHQRILDAVSDLFADDSTGHDIHHARRVYNLGMRLAEEEGGDAEVVGAACFVHDIHRVMGDGEFVSPEASLPRVREILEEAAFDQGKIDAVLHCVEVHEEYDFEEDGSSPAETLEAEIVQDADNLDAMGAIGVGRVFMFAGSHENPMWRPEREYDGETYVKDRLTDSAIYHFHEKLLRLKDQMNTETAEEIATERHEYMEAFVERFKSEWKGER